MRVSVARGELVNALTIVSRGLSSRTTLPILSGIHISCASQQVVLQATDLEVSIRTSCPALVETTGESVIPGKLLTDIIKSLPEGAVTIDTSGAGVATVTSGSSSFTLRTLSPEDYPKFPSVIAADSISIPPAVFSRLTRQVSRSVSRDETRPILTGVYLVIDGGLLRMVTTDSYRLCVREIAVPETTGSLELVVPGKATDDVARLSESSEELRIGVSENQVIFSFGTTEFISRRIEGSFPNYRQLLPKEHTTRVIVDRGEFLDAVRRVSLMAQHSTPIRLRTDVAAHTLTISSGTQDIGEASEDVQVTPEGDDVEIAFNHTYLLDGVSIAEGDTVAIEVTSPLKPGVLKTPGDEGFTYLLMPVRLG